MEWERAFGLSTSVSLMEIDVLTALSLDFGRGLEEDGAGKKSSEEISYLNRQYGKTLFIFNENTFNWSRRRVEEFLDELGDRPPHPISGFNPESRIS